VIAPLKMVPFGPTDTTGRDSLGNPTALDIMAEPDNAEDIYMIAVTAYEEPLNADDTALTAVMKNLVSDTTMVHIANHGKQDGQPAVWATLNRTHKDGSIDLIDCVVTSKGNHLFLLQWRSLDGPFSHDKARRTFFDSFKML